MMERAKQRASERLESRRAIQLRMTIAEEQVLFLTARLNGVLAELEQHLRECPATRRLAQ